MSEANETGRADGERIRARHQVEQLRTMLDAIAIDIEARGYPPGTNAAQAVTQAATTLAMTIARLDAYVRVESAMESLDAVTLTLDEVKEALRIGGEQRRAAERLSKRAPRR